MQLTLASIRDRIAYERSFTLADRWERRKENTCIWLARRLPKRLILWVITCRHADVTKDDRHPDTVKAFELYKGL